MESGIDISIELERTREGVLRKSFKIIRLEVKKDIYATNFNMIFIRYAA